MKIRFFWGVLAIVCLLTISGCTGNATTSGTGEISPVPLISALPSKSTESADDIVVTPGGYAYRANVHQEGVPDKYASIQTIETRLESGGDALTIRYRSSIATRPGETRNNIITIRGSQGLLSSESLNSIRLSISGAPQDFKFYQYSGAGLPGTAAPVLVIEIPQNLKKGSYNFNIGVEMNGLDYGDLPCTVTVADQNLTFSFV